MPAPPQIRPSEDKDTAVLVYKFSRRIRIPAIIRIPVDRRIFMEFVGGVPLLDAPLDYESRRDAARLVFRRLVLDPLFCDFMNPFSAPNRMPGISWCKRRNMPRSRWCFWTGARLVGSPHRCATRAPMAQPVRFLSVRATHANARDYSAGPSPKSLCIRTNNCWRVAEIRAIFHSGSSGITRSPANENKEKRKRKT